MLIIRTSLGGALRAIVIASMYLLEACLADKQKTYNLSFGSLAASPVVLTSMAVNGNPFGMAPQVVDARSDEVMPRANSGLFSMRYPAPLGGTVTINATWVEALTGRAFSAEAMVDASDLEMDEAGSLYLAPIFGPNGLMLLTSDPVPSSATNQPIRNLARICGRRVPTMDDDYRAKPDSLPDLADVLNGRRAGVTAPICRL